MNSVGELFSLKGRTALITGASSGIGKMIAKAMLIAGAEVWIVARGAAKLEEVAGQLGEHGTVRTIAADVTDPGDRARIAAALDEAGGKLDILVNNAGTTSQAPLETFPSEHWDLLDLNLKSPFMLIQALLPHMRRAATKAKPAQIINIGSGAGISLQTQTSFAYFASKAGLHHLTRVVARNLVGDNICANVIAPGYFRTELIESFAPTAEAQARLTANVPLGRFGEEDDAASAVLFLASSGFVTGQILALDGGFLLNG